MTDRGHKRWRPRFELVEDRTLLSTFLVDNTADSGPGSFRQAILDSDAASGGTNTIDFAIPGQGVQIIVPASPLPPVTGAVLIDGSSQAGFAGTPLIEPGSPSAGGPGGLTISGSNVTVRGLTIRGFALGTGTPSNNLTVQSGPLQPPPSGEVDTYRIDVTTDGLLVALVQPQGLTTRLSLLDSQGRVLVQSDGRSLADPENLIDEHLSAGTYFVEVESLGSGGHYALTTTLTPASAPFRPLTLSSPFTGTIPLALGDFNGDGIPDLAVPDGVHLGVGDGTFRNPAGALGVFTLAKPIIAMVSGDFNHDGSLDLAIDSYDNSSVTNVVTILLGNGDGTFQAPRTFSTGFDQVSSMVAGDFKGDGQLDLALAGNQGVIILLNNGYGTFQPPATYAAGSFPRDLVAGDFNGDGRLDLATANYGSNDVSILLNRGDGTFQPARRYAVGASPFDLVAGDFNDDGRLDLAVADQGAGDVSILLNGGDGTFQPARRYAVGGSPTDLVAGDFNDDGRLDLAVDRAGSFVISVLAGNRDGTFQTAESFSAGDFVGAMVTGYFNGDGRLDLAVANAPDNSVSILLGDGDGTFQPRDQFAVGLGPQSVTADDFNGDGRLDLVTANAGSSDISVLLGNGDGTFKPAVDYPVPGGASSSIAADFNGDGRLDLAVANGAFNGVVSVLLGNGDGSFQPAEEYAVASRYPRSMVAEDFNKDGRLDLVIDGYPDPINFSEVVTVLLGNGDGTFQAPQQVDVGSPPDFVESQLYVDGNFDADSLFGTASVNPFSNDVSVQLSTGSGTFAAPGQLAISPQARPLVADVDGDGTDDVLVVDRTGGILYRRGVPQEPGTFEPPVTINPGLPSRDIAFVSKTDQGPVIVSVDAKDNAVSLYAYREGSFIRIGSLTTGSLPAQIIAADVNGDGRDDLVVRNSGDGTLSVFFNINSGPGGSSTRIGPFLPPAVLAVGLGVSDVLSVDATGSGALGLVVTNKLTGQVSILRQLGDGTFAAPAPYRAGTGLSGLDTSSGLPAVTSLEATAGVDAGPLAPGDPTSLVTINPGSDTLDVLAGLGQGRFANPVVVKTQSPAQVVRVADFNHDGILDLAVLTANGLSIYRGDGKGGFASPVTYDVGPDPSGLTRADLNRDGNTDLLIGNPYGDVLVLLGNGDGTFQPYHKTDQAIELAVADLTGNGSRDKVYADQGLDRVVVDYSGGKKTVLGDRTTGILDPGAVKLADLNGDGIPDLIVANSGGNDVLIYPGLGNGQFGPAVNGGHGFFTGTNPAGITVADLTGGVWPNGEPRLDLVVADTGSNDVAVLLNQSQGRDISFRLGPRLKAGSGPVSTVVGDLNGDGIPDILVTNSQSNDVMLLPGVGQGFFNDTSPRTFAVGNDPGLTFVGNFDGKPDLVTVNAGSSNLTLISNFTSANPVASTIATGGTDPVAAFSFSSDSGFDNLVVGNNGDGVLALFEGSADGLTLTSSETDPEDLPSPSALVFADIDGGQVQFYAATEGREAAVLVALSLGAEIPPSTPQSPSTTTTVAQLVPLQESSQSLVGTLLIVTLQSPISEANVSTAEIEAASTMSLSLPFAAPVAVGQGVLEQGQDKGASDVGDEPPAEREETTAGAEVPAAWKRFILRTDQSLERFDREHPELSPDRRDEAPKTDPAQGHGAIPSPAKEFTLPRQGQSARDDRRIELVDQTIEFLHGHDGQIGDRGDTSDRLSALEPLSAPDAILVSVYPLRRSGQAKTSPPHNTLHRIDYSASLALALTVAGAVYYRALNFRPNSIRSETIRDGTSRLESPLL